jgi:hypothetical protein
VASHLRPSEAEHRSPEFAHGRNQMNGATVKTWDFCFQKLTLSYQ